MSWKIHVAVLALASLALATTARAKLCGDNVQGNDVACACGDIVVSDTVLDRTDPVTHDICSGDGLILRGDRLQSLNLDLKGSTLRGGDSGAGLLILYGGSKGARIFSTGSKANITGFALGVQAQGRHSLNLLSDLNITEPKRDGVRVTSGVRYRVNNVYVRDAGRNGFWLSGERFRIRKTKALNSKAAGYFIMGERATLGAPSAGPVSLGSGDSGFTLMGSGHRLVSCVAEAAGKNGVSFVASSSFIRGCRAVGNAKDGIGGTGGNIRFAANRAEENEGSGIEAHGHHMQDLGGNAGSLNRLGGLTPPAKQCEIGGRSCS